MADAEAALAEYFEDIPQDLLAYFEEIRDGSLSHLPAFQLNLLPVTEAVEQTRLFHSFHPVIQKLNGFALGDGNDSNYHFYLFGSPLSGMVLFLCHDGDTRVVYPSLKAFVSAAREAKERNCFFTDFHPELSVMGNDQAALSEFAVQLLDNDDGSGDAVVVLTAIIPSLDLHDEGLLERLAVHDDFYLGEAVANEIAKRPSLELARIARICCEHPHPQVSKAGQRAAKALAQLE